MESAVPDPKKDITIRFNWTYDYAAVDGQVLTPEQEKKLKYHKLRIRRREDRIPDPTDGRYFSIEYGWIRPSIFSTFSRKIEYVRCARFKIQERVAVPTRAGDAQGYRLQDLGFYYFIDTTTTCGRDLGSSSDCDKDTQIADANLKNQILNVRESGNPLFMTAEQREERERIIQQQKAAILQRNAESARVLAEAERYAKEHPQEEIRRTGQRKQEINLQEKILAAIDLLRSQGYIVTVPQGGLPQGGLPQGGRRTRRQSRRRKRSTRARR